MIYMKNLAHSRCTINGPHCWDLGDDDNDEDEHTQKPPSHPAPDSATSTPNSLYSPREMGFAVEQPGPTFPVLLMHLLRKFPSLSCTPTARSPSVGAVIWMQLPDRWPIGELEAGHRDPPGLWFYMAPGPSPP